MAGNIVTSKYSYYANANSVKSGEYWYDDGSSSTVDMDSFMKLMMTQLSNQDFNNAVDDSQFIQQLSQYAMVEAMNTLTEYSQITYGANLVGKEVAIYNTTDNTMTYGVVDALNMTNGELKVLVNGQSYEMSSIVQIYANEGSTSSSSNVNYNAMINTLLNGIEELNTNGLSSLNSSFSTQLQSLTKAIEELLETANKEKEEEEQNDLIESTTEVIEEALETEDPNKSVEEENEAANEAGEENAREILAASLNA